MIHKIRVYFARHDAVVFVLILLGVLLRLRQFLTGRSLWIDEAMLALNIVNRTMLELFKPLDYDQGAPLGFLLVEKIFNLLFGRNEYALRLFPLLVGILGMWAFHLLLKRLAFGTAGRYTALALFVLNPRLVYYSSEVKQYILDVFVAIILLLVAVPVLEKRADSKDILRLAIVGSLALWFSHPALFILAGIGMTLVIIHLQRRDYSGLRYVMGIGLLWAAVVALLYLLTLKDIQQNEYMKEYWRGPSSQFHRGVPLAGSAAC